MQPTATATPKPVMDVTPPAPPVKTEAALAEPPAEETSVPQSTKAPQPEAGQPSKRPVHTAKSAAKPVPVLAIALALAFFVVLSVLAFYAYSKPS